MSEKEKQLDLWSSIVFILLLATPLLHTNLTYHRVYAKLFLLQSAVVVIWMIVCVWLLRGVEVPWFERLFALALAYLIWGGLTVVWAERSWASVEPLVRRAFYVGTGVGLAFLLANRQRREFFLLGYLIVATLAGLVMVFAYGPRIEFSFAGLDVGFGGRELFFGNPDIASGFLLLPMMLGMALMSTVRDPREQYRDVLIGLACVVVGLFALIRAGTLAGILALVAGTVLVNVVCFPIWKKALKWIVAFAVIGSLVLVAFRPGVLKRGTAYSRLLIWRGSLGALRSPRLLCGYGIGNFFLVHRRYQLPEYFAQPHNAPVVLHAHNMPIEVTTDEGLIGLGILAGLIYILAKTCWQGSFTANDHYDRAIGAGVFAGLLAMVIHSLFGIAWFSIGSAENLWIAMAFVCGAFGLRSMERTLAKKLVVALTALVFVLLWGFCAIPQLRVELLLHSASVRIGEAKEKKALLLRGEVNPQQRTEIAREINSDLASALSELEKAKNLRYESLLTLTARVKQVSAFSERDMYGSALRVCDEIESLAPDFGEVDLNRMRIEANIGRFDRAYLAYRKFLDKNPYSPSAHIGFSQLVRRQLYISRVLSGVRSLWGAVSLPQAQLEKSLYLRLFVGEISEVIEKSSDPRLHYVLADTLFDIGKPQQAKRYFESTERICRKRLEKNEEDLIAHEFLGRTIRNTDPIEAEKHLRKVVEADPSRLDIRIIVESLTPLLKKSEESSAGEP